MEMEEELWKNTLKLWLSKCFNINKPSKRQLEMTDAYLNSINVKKEHIISFCKTTRWKHGHTGKRTFVMHNFL